MKSERLFAFMMARMEPVDASRFAIFMYISTRTRTHMVDMIASGAGKAACSAPTPSQFQTAAATGSSQFLRNSWTSQLPHAIPPKHGP